MESLRSCGRSETMGVTCHGPRGHLKFEEQYSIRRLHSALIPQANHITTMLHSSWLPFPLSCLLFWRWSRSLEQLKPDTVLCSDSTLVSLLGHWWMLVYSYFAEECPRGQMYYPSLHPVHKFFSHYITSKEDCRARKDKLLECEYF